MNTRQPIDTSSGPVALSVAFNQDNTCFAVGLDTGFCVYNTEPCELKVSRDFNAGIGQLEMLGRANFIALVGGGKQPKYAQNKVVIWDDSKQRPAFTPLEFRAQVHRVRLSRNRIVVALQNTVHVYNFAMPPERLAIYETADNPLGLCCLGAQMLAFPGITPGQVQLVEIATGNVSIFPAHTAPLRGMALSADGNILATASETGTLIRVFSTQNCNCFAELRRGVDHASIFSLAISPDNKLLAATSDKSTLHIFHLPRPLPPPSSPPPTSRASTSPQLAPADESQKWGILGRIPLLPRLFSDDYSIASAPFEMGAEPAPAVAGAALVGLSGGRPAKGVIGWVGDTELVVVGAGSDERWEKFVVQEVGGGRRACLRTGWKRYLGAA
ncbi:MAG: Phosphatidylinositol 3,5-bisphosphate-binding protein [Trizodia sp. TS-e1964]|nr:MAG: Phosphatidylinositol 3,5-bisphosphate-binding protein [Trizodia sp. TS-e1964]